MRKSELCKWINRISGSWEWILNLRERIAQFHIYHDLVLHFKKSRILKSLCKLFAFADRAMLQFVEISCRRAEFGGKPVR